MPKTTDSVAQACAKIEIQPGCTGTWYDISGETNLATLPKEVLTTGSVAVFDDDTHVISAGKKPPITATFAIVYTENPAEAWELVRAVWQAQGCERPMCVRATPKGGSVGDMEIGIGDANHNALLVGFSPPTLNAGAGEPAIAEFDVLCNYYYDVKAS
jgi:hypothetical protein